MSWDCGGWGRDDLLDGMGGWGWGKLGCGRGHDRGGWWWEDLGNFRPEILELMLKMNSLLTSRKSQCWWWLRYWSWNWNELSGYGYQRGVGWDDELRDGDNSGGVGLDGGSGGESGEYETTRNVGVRRLNQD